MHTCIALFNPKKNGLFAFTKWRSKTLNRYKDLTMEQASLNASKTSIVGYQWQPLSYDPGQPMPAQRSKHTMCMSDGAIYIFGGRDRSIVHKHLWRYKLDVGSWEKLATKGDKPLLLQEHTMVAYKKNLYVFGGQFSSGSELESPLWIFNTDTQVWRKHRPQSEVMTPQGRRGHSAIVIGSQMVVFGGYLDMRGSSSELWLFDMDVEMWHLECSSLTEGPGGRHGHSAVLYDHAMWVLGGMCDLQPCADLWKWDFGAYKWSRVRCRNSPPEVHGHTACVMLNHMYVVGGESQWLLQDAIWQYSFGNMSWQKLKCDGEVPMARCHHTCVAIPSFLLDAPINDHEGSLSVPALDNLCPPLPQVVRPRSSPCETNWSSKDQSDVRSWTSRQSGRLMGNLDEKDGTDVNGNQASQEQLSNLQDWSHSEENSLVNRTKYEPHMFRNKISPSEGYSSVEPLCLTRFQQQPKQERDPHSQSTHSDTKSKLNKRSSKCLDSSEPQFWSQGALDISPLVPSQKNHYHTSEVCFENPLFTLDSSGDELDLISPSKRSRPSLDLDTDSDPLMKRKLGKSADSVFLASDSQERLDSVFQVVQAPRLPGIVKSGSLDSVLQGLGAVKINYLQVDSQLEPDSSEVSEAHRPVIERHMAAGQAPEAADQTQGSQQGHFQPGRSPGTALPVSAGLLLEDIEHCDYRDLEESHRLFDQTADTQPLISCVSSDSLDDPKVSNSHLSEARKIDSGFENPFDTQALVSSRNESNSSESGYDTQGICDRQNIQLGTDLTQGSAMPNQSAPLQDIACPDYYLSKDFRQRCDQRGKDSLESFELQTYPECSGHRGDRRSDPKNLMSLFTSGSPHRTRESVSTSRGTSGFREPHLCMILCGGKEITRKSCDILPLQMWRFDVLENKR